MAAAADRLATALAAGPVIRATAVVAAALAMAGCADEGVSGYAAEGPWRLTEVSGRSTVPPATLTFPGRGRVEGMLPCNAFSARQAAPYPWFELSDIRVGGAVCDARQEERQILAALSSATLVEALGGVLILSDDSGPLLVFRLG
jgi:heat shock protein HslJ